MARPLSGARLDPDLPFPVPPTDRLGARGYPLLLGLRVMGALELVERVKAGLPFKAMVRFQERTGLSAAAVADLIQVPLRTLNRRKTEGRFTPDESDRLLRAARIFGLALDLFEGRDQEARQWLERSQPALGGATPLSLAATEVGGREVEELIGRLEHGIPT